MSVSPFRFPGEAGRESLRAIAAGLEERGISAPWHEAQVGREIAIRRFSAAAATG
jgi:hypothetical protein